MSISPRRPREEAEAGVVTPWKSREWEPVDIEMNRHHLARILDRVHTAQRERVAWEDAVPWLIGGAGFLQALIPNDFSNFLDVDSTTWKGASIGISVFLFAVGVRKLWLAFKSWRTRFLTTDEIIEQLMEDMPPRRLEGNEHAETRR